MEGCLLKLRNYLVDKKIIKKLDEVSVRRGLNTDTFVYVNGKPIGSCEYNGHKSQYKNFKVFNNKPKKVYKILKQFKGNQQPNKSFEEIKNERKQMWQKDTFVIGDFVKYGKIKL